MKVSAIIAAAGNGDRMDGEGKVFSLLENIPIVMRPLVCFEECESIDEIILVANRNKLDYCEELIEDYLLQKTRIVVGGDKRQDSVYNGLNAINDSDYVVVHDGVRPFVREEDIEASIKCAVENYGGCALAIPVNDTVKFSSDGFFEKTIDRENLWLVQTPQTFRFDVLMKAHEKAREDKFYGSDDSSLVERYGYRVKKIRGSNLNVKLTVPDDWELIKIIAEKMK